MPRCALVWTPKGHSGNGDNMVDSPPGVPDAERHSRTQESRRPTELLAESEVVGEWVDRTMTYSSPTVVAWLTIWGTDTWPQVALGRITSLDARRRLLPEEISAGSKEP
jgi:hypothetical protein